VLNLLAPETKIETPVCHHSLGDHPVIWWQIDYIEPLSSQKGQCLPLLGWTLTLGVDLPSLPKLSLLDLWNVLFTIMIFHTAFILANKLNSQSEKYSIGLMLMECTGVNMFPTILKQVA
jgi:hypothetical protein